MTQTHRLTQETFGYATLGELCDIFAGSDQRPTILNKALAAAFDAEMTRRGSSCRAWTGLKE